MLVVFIGFSFACALCSVLAVLWPGPRGACLAAALAFAAGVPILFLLECVSAAAIGLMAAVGLALASRRMVPISYGWQVGAASLLTGTFPFVGFVGWFVALRLGWHEAGLRVFANAYAPGGLSTAHLSLAEPGLVLAGAVVAAGLFGVSARRTLFGFLIGFILVHMGGALCFAAAGMFLGSSEGGVASLAVLLFAVMLCAGGAIFWKLMHRLRGHGDLRDLGTLRG